MCLGFVKVVKEAPSLRMELEISHPDLAPCGRKFSHIHDLFGGV